MFKYIYFYDALIKVAPCKNNKKWWKKSLMGTINIVLAPQNKRFYFEIEHSYSLAHPYRWKEDNIWQNI